MQDWNHVEITSQYDASLKTYSTALTVKGIPRTTLLLSFLPNLEDDIEETNETLSVILYSKGM